MVAAMIVLEISVLHIGVYAHMHFQQDSNVLNDVVCMDSAWLDQVW